MSHSPGSISHSRSGISRYKQLMDDDTDDTTIIDEQLYIQHRQRSYSRSNTHSSNNTHSNNSQHNNNHFIDLLSDPPIYATTSTLYPTVFNNTIDTLNGPAVASNGGSNNNSRPSTAARQLSTPVVPIKTNRLTELLKRAVSINNNKENNQPLTCNNIQSNDHITTNNNNMANESTYATQLNSMSGLRYVMKYSTDSHRVVKRVASLFNKLSSIQQKSALDMQKCIDYEASKLHDQCVQYPYDTNLNVLLHELRTMSTIYHTYGTDISLSACEPLNKLFTVSDEQCKEHAVKIDRLISEVNKIETQLNNEQNDAQNALNQLYELYHTTTSNNNHNIHNTNNNSSVSSKQSTQLNKLRQKAIEICDRYNATVNHANNVMKPNIDSELYDMLVQLQCLEELRIHSYKSCVNQFSILNNELHHNIRQVTHEIDSVFNGLDSQQVIQQQIFNALQQINITNNHNTAPNTNKTKSTLTTTSTTQWTYTLPITATQLRSFDWQYCLDTLYTVNASLFSMTLQQIQSSSTHWNIQYQVPQLLITLCEYIESQCQINIQCNNSLVEGIYRISVESRQIADLQSQLESGNYNISKHTVHTCCALLKQWIRTLSTPIIPYTLYTQCIEIGQLFNNNTGIIQHKLIQFYSLLPDINKSVLTYLIQHISRLHSNYHVSTRMNIDAYAIVLSPNLCRTRTNDTQTLLQDTKHATSFCNKLITNIQCMTQSNNNDTAQPHINDSNSTGAAESVVSPRSNVSHDEFVSAISICGTSSVVDELNELDSKYTVDFDSTDGSLIYRDQVTGQRYTSKPNDVNVVHTG